MTDRIKGFTVVLENSIREYDFEKIKNLFHMIKGVDSIEEYLEDAGDFIAEQRAKNNIRAKILDTLFEK